MRSQRVLIVDDERESADLLKLIIEAELDDASVDVAYDGLQALALASAHLPDVIIMDLEMPRLGGQEAAEQIRRRFGAQSPLLVALSGNVNRIRQLRTSGPFDHALTKPLDVSALMHILAYRTMSKDT